MFRFSRAGFVVTRLAVREGNKVAIDRVNMSVPVLFFSLLSTPLLDFALISWFFSYARYASLWKAQKY